MQITNKPTIFYLLLAGLMMMPLQASSQVWEDFADGDLSANIGWTGDTVRFRVNGDNHLQLYTEGADSAQMAFRYSMPDADTLTWIFWCKLGFTPTDNNRTLVTLCADSADRHRATHSLAVAIIDPRFGGKVISLLGDGTTLFRFDYSPALNTNALRFKIQLVGRQHFDLWIDTLGDTEHTDFAYAGSTTVPAINLPDEAWFGLWCRFTSSRARHFYFDDIGINADGPTDISPETPLLPGDILVNELLFNPEPGGADYVELYNNSDSTVALKRLRLARMVDDSVARLYPIATAGTLAPHDFLVVTTDALYVRTHYTVRNEDKLLEISSMPAYNDASGSVVVTDADTTVLDRFDYTEKMHSRLLHDKEGVALERRSYDVPTQQENNWFSAASTAGFGTPTYRNSQSHEFLFVDDDFHVEQTLFSPDGDGYNDLLDITWQLTMCDLSCNIDIYDAHGRMVRHLLRGATLGCDGTVSWDGTDEAGKRCLRGNYLIVAEAYNEKGASQSWRRRVALVVK